MVRNLKICLIAERRGIHEERFLKGFSALGHDVHFLHLDECVEKETTVDDIDIYVVGPLHLIGNLTPSWFNGAPYVCLSYAYDVLHELKQQDHPEHFNEFVKASAGLITDTEKVLDSLNLSLIHI